MAKGHKCYSVELWLLNPDESCGERGEINDCYGAFRTVAAAMNDATRYVKRNPETFAGFTARLVVFEEHRKGEDILSRVSVEVKFLKVA